jgi:hypothetical protein
VDYVYSHVPSTVKLGSGHCMDCSEGVQLSV